MNAWAKNTISAIVGGTILFLVTAFLETPVSPKADLRWGTYDGFNVPRDLGGIAGFSILLENRGRKPANDIEITFSDEPTSISVDPPIPFKTSQSNNGFILEFDTLGAGDEARLQVYGHGIHTYAVRLVRESGEQVEEAHIPDDDFGRVFGVEVPLMVFFLMCVLSLRGVIEMIMDFIAPRKKMDVEPDGKGETQ